MATALAVGAIAKGIGSIFSGIGASNKAKALRGATTQASRRVSDFTNQFSEESKALKGTKLGILNESADVFDRLGGFIFGDTDSLSSLREAQSEFSALAAGDTSGFTREVESIVKSALAGTFGSPKGAFENLSAKNLFNFRSGGLQNALSLTNTFSSLGSGLINTEFGIHDQDFQNRLRLRENEVNQLNALSLQAAGTRGTGAAAIGNVFDTIGQGIFSVSNQNDNRNLSSIYALAELIRAQQGASQGGANRAVPVLPGIQAPTPFALPATNPLGGTTTPVNFNSDYRGDPVLYDDATPPLPSNQYQFPDFYSSRPDFRFYQDRAIDALSLLPPK